MEIIQKDTISIITPFSPRLGKYEAKRLANVINQEARQIAINLNFVSDCTIEFIEELKNIAKIKNIGIFNIPSDIFTIFNIMKIDKTINLYTSELDFTEQKRQLINRSFSIL